MTDVLVVLGVLALVVVLLGLYLKLRPRFLAAALTRRPETRPVHAAAGSGPGSWQLTFIATTTVPPERRADAVAALTRLGGGSDLLRGLLAARLAEVLANRLADDATFDGKLDDRLRTAVATALDRDGLRLERLDLFHAVQLDVRLARLANYVVCDAQQGLRQGDCELLELYVDGISGLGACWAHNFETGWNKFQRSTDIVRTPTATLEVMRKPGRLASYRTLASMLAED